MVSGVRGQGQVAEGAMEKEEGRRNPNHQHRMTLNHLESSLKLILIPLISTKQNKERNDTSSGQPIWTALFMAFNKPWNWATTSPSP